MAKNGQDDQGAIDPARCYPIKAFERVTGLGRAARCEAHKNGLPIRYVGKTGWILGEDFIAYVKTKGKTPDKRPKQKKAAGDAATNSINPDTQ